MSLRKMLFTVVAFVSCVSFAGAQIFIIKDGVSTGYKPGSVVSVPGSGQTNTAVMFNNTKIGLDSGAGYSFEEVQYQGKKALSIKSLGEGVIIIGDTVIKTGKGVSTLLLTPDDNGGLQVEVLKGNVSFLNKKSKASGTVYEGQKFSILDLEYNQSLDTSAFDAKRDLFVTQLSASNP